MTHEGLSWSSGWSAAIGRNIQAARGRAHLTGEQLARRTRDLGYEVTRSAIANIESGRRDTVTVQQVTVIAMALDTSPVRLLFDPTAPETDLLPADPVSGIEASEWWSGNIRYLHSPLDPSDRALTTPVNDLYERRKVFQLQQALTQAVADLDRLERVKAATAADPVFALDLDTAQHKVTAAATYLAGAVGNHKPWLPASAVVLLDSLAERGLFAWPEDLFDGIERQQVEPWPGEHPTGGRPHA
jgi:transcriptional regulator with XRE-family HTH domain